jgi:hypothetical protein
MEYLISKKKRSRPLWEYKDHARRREGYCITAACRKLFLNEAAGNGRQVA